jgi:hypothetical protein
MRSSTMIWIAMACVALSGCSKKNSLYMEAGGASDAHPSGRPASNGEPRPQPGAVPPGPSDATPSQPTSRP